MVKENLQNVQTRIAAAAKKVGRDPSSVRLVCVTKGITVEQILEAVGAGVQEIGENRVQEAQAKQLAVGKNLRWHLIGHLQRNKAKPAVSLFDWIHSVDSLELIELLNQQAAGLKNPVNLLLQVNVSGEMTKSGCRPEEAGKLEQVLLTAKNLQLHGLMTMAPYSENPESARPFFRRLRELRDSLEKELRLSLPELSMGMSGDFETAIEEGATMVRIGTAIFGERVNR